MGHEDIGVSVIRGIDGMLKNLKNFRVVMRDKMEVLQFKETADVTFFNLHQIQKVMILAEMIYHPARS